MAIMAKERRTRNLRVKEPRPSCNRRRQSTKIDKGLSKRDAKFKRRTKSLKKAIKKNRRLTEHLNEQLTRLTTTIEQANTHLPDTSQINSEMRNLSNGMGVLLGGMAEYKEGMQQLGDEMQIAEHNLELFSETIRRLFDNGTEALMDDFQPSKRDFGVIYRLTEAIRQRTQKSDVGRGISRPVDRLFGCMSILRRCLDDSMETRLKNFEGRKTNQLSNKLSSFVTREEGACKVGGGNGRQRPGRERYS